MLSWKKFKELLSKAIPGSIVDKQKKVLARLRSKSVNAFGVVISTIRKINDINGEINNAMNLIEGYQTDLAATHNHLKNTKDKNLRILDRFQALLDEENGARE